MTQSRQMLIGKPKNVAGRSGSSTPPTRGSKRRARTLPLIYESVLVYAYALQHLRGERSAPCSLRVGIPTISSPTDYDTVQRWLIHGNLGTALNAAPASKRPSTSDDSAREPS
jgi:hypothetical protein